MLKHPLNKHPKKRHFKKHAHEIIKKIREPFFPLLTFGLTMFGIFLLLISVFFGIWRLGIFEIKYSDRFYPGVFVAGEAVGGQTYAEALDHFQIKADEIEKSGLTANFESSKGVKNINIPMNYSGLTTDNSVEYFTLDNWQDDLEKAYRYGHGANIFRILKERIVLIFKNKYFTFSASIQKEALDSMLESELDNFYKKNTPAQFSYDGKNISISQEENGETLDRDEIINTLQKKLMNFDATPETFRAHEDIPTVTKKDLEPFSDFAETFAQKTNLVLQYKKHEWKIKGSKLVTWLTVKNPGEISIDRNKLEDYLTNTVARFIDNPPKNSRFEMRDGKLFEIFTGTSGNVVDIEKTAGKIERLIPEIRDTFAKENLSASVINSVDLEPKFNAKNGTIYIPIETVTVEPKVTKETIEKYHIRDLVGKIYTSYEGSTASREHNIKIGISAITGMLIAPGEEFSTVSSIGPVTAKEGYLKELVIKADRTTKEYGGGLCQVATSLFRLALNAGLPITERQNHRFVVHYYGAGLDATIYGPHPDLRFVNDTGGYLLLQARVDTENKKVFMELYGQKDGRIAEVSAPYLYNDIPAPPTKYVQTAELEIGQTKCTESPHAGVTASASYNVTYPDGTVKHKNFQSIYQPWQKVCLIGTRVPMVETVSMNPI